MDQLLVKVLADGEFHSGAHLGELLGVSRTAVWKHLQKLEALGLGIESVKGKGYRIAGGLELLDLSRIKAVVTPKVVDELHRIDVLESVDSTNRHLMALGEAANRAVCLAEYQSQGRGRRGRSWISPFGKNLYLSVGWQFDGGAASLEGLSLVVGIAVRRALGESDQLRLKWPNDLHYQGRKLAGILLEMQGDPAGICHVVIGIGVNAGMGEGSRPDIDQPWSDASELGIFSRNQLAGQILNELIPVLLTFGERGFRYYREEWNCYDACRDHPVRLYTPVLEIMGVARGVADNGAILIEMDGVTKEFNGGELSLRLVK
jgi:BirA family transcriptional regulator, biotin operon repressor / biotin---[acetyl-CoA-carboxylase] ligase